MKKFLFLLFLQSLVLYNPTLNAQSPLKKQWDKRFGGTSEDIPYSTNENGGEYLQVTKDGGYIIGGRTQSGAGADKTQSSWGQDDFWVVKTDANGVKQWDKRYGGTGWEELYGLITTSDGGFLFAGMSGSNISGDKSQNSFGSNYDYWVIKTDSLGNKQWDKTYGGDQDDRCNYVQQTKDGGYILCGYTTSGISGNKTQPLVGGADYWIIKIDSVGKIQWQKDYGGTSSDFGNCAKQTMDGGYIVVGATESGIGGDKTGAKKAAGFSFDYWVLKLDSSGNKIWDKDFGGTYKNIPSSVLENSDHTFLLYGNAGGGIGGDKSQTGHGDMDIWMVKIDSSGNKIWDQCYGGSLEEEAGDISFSNDGNILFAADSYSPASGNISVGNLAAESIWIVKMDTAGKILWEKSLNADHAEYANICETAGGCYIVGGGDNGGIVHDRTQDNRGGYDYWIVKLCDSTYVGPPVSIFESSDTAFCAESGSCIDFFDHSTNNPTSWKWFFPGAVPDTSTLQNPTYICYSMPGTYAVKLIVSNSNGSDSLTVSPMITFATSASPPVLSFSGDTLYCSHAVAYQWYYNGFPVPLATDSFFVTTMDGVFAVQITDSNGCERLSDGFLVSVNESNGAGGIKIYPSPLRESLVISHWSLGLKSRVNIYNVLGEKILQSEIIPIKSGQKSEIGVFGLAKGIYIVELISGDKVFRTRMIKE